VGVSRARGGGGARSQVAMRKTKSSTEVTWRKKSVRAWRNKLVAGSRAPISEGLCIYRRVLN
jgi:hypothetical protein